MLNNINIAKENENINIYEQSQLDIFNNNTDCDIIITKDDIKTETEKAYLINKNDKEFWIQKRWLRDDGTLTPAGQQNYKEAKTNTEKQLEKEKKAKQDAEGVKIPEKIDYESEKAYGFDFQVRFPNTDTFKTIRTFIPKSQIQENGNIPMWLINKKIREVYEEIEFKYDGDRYGHYEVYNPFENNNGIYHQTANKKIINGYFDSELKTILLGENLNNGTLPHEMAHFFLDRTFNLWRDNQGTKEFRTFFDKIAESLDISKEQSSLTTEQQEKFARMTEAYLFGMGIPEGQKGIFDLFYKWRPSQYKGIQDLH